MKSFFWSFSCHRCLLSSVSFFYSRVWMTFGDFAISFWTPWWWGRRMSLCFHTTATKEAFITLKDHKDNFESKLTCRLINPSKQEIGKISKQILDNIKKKLLNVTKANQWKNTSSVLQWFKNLPNKSRCVFITFDVVEFYPSISETLLERALDFAANYVTISEDDRP